MEECSVLIETTKSAEDKTSRWFDLPIDYELFRDLLGVEADSKDYQITDMKLPFAGDIVRTTSCQTVKQAVLCLHGFIARSSAGIQRVDSLLWRCRGFIAEVGRISVLSRVPQHHGRCPLPLGA